MCYHFVSVIGSQQNKDALPKNYKKHFFCAWTQLADQNRRIHSQYGYTNTQGRQWEVSFAQGNVTDAEWKVRDP
jgi:hypothetical protein